MNASKAFTLIAHRTIQTTKPSTVVRMRPMRAGRLPQRAREAFDQRADVLTLSRGTHQP
jgi:hypothetical protein